MKFKLGIILLSMCTQVLAFDMLRESGGDDAGNGGFAYKQSIIILEMATDELEHKIINSDLKELNDFPERRRILAESLNYDRLQKLPKKNAYRGGRKLAMDYVVNPPAVKILKPYYESFMGKTDGELDEASLEVQKRLLHEASHIWGFNEKESEAFALRFLNETKVGETRPTNQIDFEQDFCSCINGKADSIGVDCNSFCQMMPHTTSPILYLKAIMGPDITNNPKLGNLYNWCNVKLESDNSVPQCILSAHDGITVNHIPVTIKPGSNSLAANIQGLLLDRAYILKILEWRTGSQAQSKEIQIRRKKAETPGDELGSLKVMPISQYTCINYGSFINSNGEIVRNSYARVFHYFAANESPAPIPPRRGRNPSQIVCHDEQNYPDVDRTDYPRLEIISEAFSMWDKADYRFININGNLTINNILQERLYSEYGITMDLHLFNLISVPTPNSGAYTQLGFMMLPFIDKAGMPFCPSIDDLKRDRSSPLFALLGEYIVDTEGLFFADREAEVIDDNSTPKTIYSYMFVTESIVKKYGFYIENGQKKGVTLNAMNAKTIHYYWPISTTMDPLNQGHRKLFTVRLPDTAKGNIPDGILSHILSPDKRIGCIPKGEL